MCQDCLLLSTRVRLAFKTRLWISARALLACSGMSLATPCWAGIVWSATRLRLARDAAHGSAVGTFVFRNSGNRSLRVKTVTPSCDCVVTRLDKELLAPGEAGELRVTLAVHGEDGHEERTISVVTDDASTATVLRVEYEGSSPVIFSANALVWPCGGAAEPKTVEVTASSEASIRGVQSVDSFFDAELDHVSNGIYRVRVKPRNTATPVQTTLRVNAMVGTTPKVFVVYAAVK
jgi:hypothetical protein